MIIAEIGQNHNGSMSLAKELIEAAHECGADVAKFQLFSAVDLFSKSNNPWYSYNLSTELNYDQAEELASFCREIGIEFMASAFDPTRVDWLEKLEVRRHKLASRSIFDTELIDSMVRTKKQIIVSLGFWKEDILPPFDSSVQVSFLHCISRYPAPLDSVMLSKIDFSKISGLSDHCIGLSAAVTAIALGAKIVEKHFTLDKKMYGPDHSCSANPEEFAQLVNFYKEIKACL